MTDLTYRPERVQQDALAAYIRAEEQRARELNAELARRRAEEDAEAERQLAQRVKLLEQFLAEPLDLVSQVRAARDQHLQWEEQMLAKIAEQVKAIPAKDRKRIDARLLEQTKIAPLVEKRSPSRPRRAPRRRPTESTPATAAEPTNHPAQGDDHPTGMPTPPID